MIVPARLDPEAVHDDSSLYQVFGLTPTALASARRAGTLRFARSGKRILYLGSWVRDWLERTAAQPVTSQTEEVAS
jgi:hypothetical protein